ncbi:MAG: BON domain-containing protein [Planctomycetia bacterium]|nr:BON domain-containing protein [Planctomycetia bacterium]
MLRKHLFISAAMLVLPAGILAQGNNQAGMGSGSMGQGTGNTSGNGIVGQANTTLLGSNVNVNFESVFGNAATIANTNPDPFAAYRPSGSGTGSTTGTGMGFAGTGSGFAGTGGGGLTGGGMGTTGRTGTGLGANTGLGGNTGLRGGTGLGGGGLGGGGLGAGTLGGGFGGGGLGGNRMGMGGMQNMMGGNRMGMGMMGGTGFLGNNSAFLGGNNQMNQTQQASIGYQVNYEGKAAPAAPTGGNAVAIGGDFTQRLTSSPGMQGAQNLQVLKRGETAILRGQVTSDYSRQLAAAMVQLEPGVYEVQNELQVVAPVK